MRTLKPVIRVFLNFEPAILPNKLSAKNKIFTGNNVGSK